MSAFEALNRIQERQVLASRVPLYLKNSPNEVVGMLKPNDVLGHCGCGRRT
jgi:CBS domain containing-hemolysin-like protein